MLRTKRRPNIDETRFDRVVRFLSTTPTRRGILGALTRAAAGATFAALGAMPGSNAVAASCRGIGDVCTRTRQCCGHKKKKRVCASNDRIGAPTERSCCILLGKRCSSTVECCGDGTVGCAGTPGDERCGFILSDRAVKTDFATVDGQAVLAQVASLPIQSWRYRTDDTAVRHIGPMAQDFAASFHVGDNDRHIHAVDGQGVALAAIQGLIQEVRALQAQNATLMARVAALEGRRDA